MTEQTSASIIEQVYAKIKEDRVGLQPWCNMTDEEKEAVREFVRPSPQQQSDTFVQDETQIVRGPLGPTYATKLVKGQPDELSKAQERQLVSLQKVTDEWHETDERIGFGQFVFKYYDVCRRLEDPKP